MDPKIRGAQPVDPEGSAGRFAPRTRRFAKPSRSTPRGRLAGCSTGPKACKALAGRSRRIGWQGAPRARRPAERRFTDPEVRETGARHSRRSVERFAPPPRGAAERAPRPRRGEERLTGRDAPDLTASSSGRPPHHRRLRRVAPPAWPSSLADPALVAEGVRRFLVWNPLSRKRFPELLLAIMDFAACLRRVDLTTRNSCRVNTFCPQNAPQRGPQLVHKTILGIAPYVILRPMPHSGRTCPEVVSGPTPTTLRSPE